MDHSQILDGLNEAQQKAVTATEGPLLVVAGPGTGKTLTIVRRIAWLVRKGVPPENILAVTFTNRAAREMKERTAAFLGNDASRIFVGTFHLLGLRILRENRAGDFTLCGRDEQVSLLKSFMKGTAKAIDQAKERISRIKNFLEDAGDFKEILGAYQSALEQKNALDFDDLIRIPIELLQDTAVARTCQERFRYIIVDEYQDINPAQYRLLRLLTGSGSNICAVGDADQAIYSFRGADLCNFLDFEKDFPRAVRILLSENYRSSGTILDAAQRVIGNNQKRIDKEVSATRERGLSLGVISVPDERTEGELIINEIEARMGGTSHERQRRNASCRTASDRPCRFSDFAVIYRTNAQAKALEDAFSASGIPYQVIGKRNSAQRREAEETLAFLRSLACPDGRQEPASNGDAKLLSEADYFDPRAEAVALMTMHTAKGLEFPVVFITGCEEGLLPYTVLKDAVDVEEERRLFYVGMTRAKEELFLIHSRKRFLYGLNLDQKASPFIAEIPGGLKENRIVPDRIRKEKPGEKQMGLF